MYVMYYTQFTNTTHEINALRFPVATRVTCSGIIYTTEGIDQSRFMITDRQYTMY